MLTRHAEVIDSALDDAEKDIRTVVEREWKGDASGKYLDSWTLMFIVPVTRTVLISVAASVTAYYICKWLDGEK